MGGGRLMRIGRATARVSPGVSETARQVGGSAAHAAWTHSRTGALGGRSVAVCQFGLSGGRNPVLFRHEREDGHC